MKIFRRKLISETTVNYGVVLFMTIGIFTVVKFLGLLKRAVQGNLPVDGLAVILSLKLATFLDVILTPALYIAILLVMIRWNRDNEITAYATGGIGPMGYSFPAFLVAAIAAIVVAVCSFLIAPSAEKAYQQKLENYRQSLRNIPFEEGRFRDFHGGQNVVYFGRKNGETENPIRLFYIVSDPKGKEIIVARDGHYELDLKDKVESLQLSEGNRYRISIESGSYELTEFDGFTEIIPVAEFELSTLVTKAKSTIELIGSDSPEDMAELDWRISKVITMPLVVLLAFAFGSCRISSRVSVDLIGAVLVYFFYSSFVGFIADIERTEILGIDIFLWLPHLIVVFLIVWVVFRSHHNRRIFST